MKRRMLVAKEGGRGFGAGLARRGASAQTASPPPLRFEVVRHALAAVVGFSLLFPIGTAQAQDPVSGVLVSNINQMPGGSEPQLFDWSQAFTTGGFAGGYKLTSVDFSLALGAAGTAPAVEIWSDSPTSPGEPGSLAHTLTNPDTLINGTNSFTASGEGIDLNANTKYHVVLNHSATGPRNITVGRTQSTSEDASSAAGWSIDDTDHFRGQAATSWTDGDRSMRIAVHGYPKGDATAPTFSSATVAGSMLTLTYSEALDPGSIPAPGDFTVTVDGSDATVSRVIVSGSTVMLTLGAAVTSNATVTVSYTAPATNPIQDAGGNAAADLAAQTITATADTTPPVLLSAVVDGKMLTLTYDELLNEGVVPFSGNYGVTVDGVAKGNPPERVVTGFTIVLTLREAVNEGSTVTLSYGAGSLALQDLAGNPAPNFDAQPVTVLDRTPPSLRSAALSGTTLRLIYDEELNTASVPAADDFTVTAGGTEVSLAATNPVDVTGFEVTLTLAVAPTAPPVTVSYAAGTMPIQDASENDAADFDDRAVAVDLTPPSIFAATLAGTSMRLFYSEALDATSVPAASAFTVTVGGNDAALAATDPVDVSGFAVTLTLAAAPASGMTILVSYAAPASNPIQDLAGNDAADFTDRAVSTPTGTGAPTLSAATASGTSLTLTYNKELDTNSTPALTAFTVAVDSGTGVNPTAVMVTGSTVVLTLAAAVTSSQAVTVSYTVPATNPIQDTDGNAAAALTDAAVTTSTAPITTLRLAGLTAEYSRSATPDTYESLAFTFGADTLSYSLEVPHDAGKVRFDPSAGTAPVALEVKHTPPSGTEVTLPGELTSNFMLLFAADLDVVGAHRFDFVLTPVAGTGTTTYTVTVTKPSPPPADTTAPILRDATVDGTMLTLVYNEDLDPASRPAATAFDVTVGTAAAVNPSSVAVTGSTVVLTLATAVTAGQTVTLTYTVPSSNPIRDAAQNPAAALTDQSVTVTTVPTLTAATLAGTSLRLFYDKLLDTDSVPAADAFTVMVGGSDADLADTNPVAVVGFAVVLTLAAEVAAGQPVTVSYTAPTGAMATPIQDAAGNAAIGFTDRAVSTPPDPTLPALSAATVDGSTLTLTYNKALNTMAPAATAFTVKVDSGTGANPSSVMIAGSTVLLALANAVTAGQTVTVSYTAPATNPIQDADGNAAADFTDQAVDVAPAMTSLQLSGLKIEYARGSTPDTYENLVYTFAAATLTYSLPVPGDVARVRLSPDAGGNPLTLAATHTPPSGGPFTLAGFPLMANLDVDGAHLFELVLTPVSGSGTATYAVTLTKPSAPPVLSTATVARRTLTLTYDEPLDAGSVPAATAFAVTVGTATAVNPSSVIVAGSTVALTLATAVSDSATVTVSYTKGTMPIRDRAGNDAADLIDQAVTTVPTGTAELSGITIEYATSAAPDTYVQLNYMFNKDTLAYSLDVPAEASKVRLSAFIVSTGNTEITHTTPSGMMSTLTGFPAPAALDEAGEHKFEVTLTGTGGRSGTVTYTVFLTKPAVADTTAPMLTTATLSGATLTLTYNERLDANSTPAASAFTVMANTMTASLAGTNPVAVDGSTVVLTLASAPASGATVTVSYVVPATMPIQDAASNAAAALTNETVTVLSSDATLSALALTDASDMALTFTPTFAAATTAYMASVDNAVTSVKVAATVTDTNATLAGSLTKAGGAAQVVTMTSGAAATLSALAEGANVLTVTVTAQDGTTQAYTLTVTRAAAPVSSDNVVVSNTEQTLSVDEFPFSLDQAQGFTTGDHAAGYLLTQVDWQISLGTTGTTLPLPVYTLEIWSDSATESGRPGSRLSQLTPPGTLSDGINSFTATGAGVVLDANTIYHVVLDVSDNTNKRTVLTRTTDSNAEDTGAASGWSIADSVSTRDFDSTGTWSGSSESVSIAISATARPSDTTAPMLTGATVEGTTLVLTYDEALDEDSVPAGSAFTVEVDSVGVSLAGTDPVDVTGSTVVLTLASAVTSGSVELDYAVPATNPIQDTSDNDAGALTDEMVTVVDTTPPMLTSAVLMNGTDLTLTFNESLVLMNPALLVTFFTVNLGTGAEVTLQGASANAAAGRVTLIIPAVAAGATLTVTYTVPASNFLQDAAGNKVAAFTNHSVTIPDTTAPMLTGATVEGTTLVLTYNEPLDLGSVPAATDFAVAVGSNSAHPVPPVVISGSTVTLTLEPMLASLITPSSTVTLHYTVPGTTPLQDEAGNAAAALSGETVTVVDTTPPSLARAVISGTTLTLTYDEALGAASMPPADNFTVRVDGTEAPLALTGSVAVAGSTVTLTLATAVTAGSMVTVSYTVPATGAIQDAAGNTAAALTNQAVSEPDTTAPAITSAVLSGTSLRLGYDEELNEDSTPAASDFAVKVDGTAVDLAATGAVDVSGFAVTLTLAAAASGTTVTVSYTVPTGAMANPIQDTSGNNAAGFTDRAVTLDTTPPTLLVAALADTSLSLFYTEALDETSVPAAGDFTVKVDGTAVNLAATDPVDVSGFGVLLTLAAAPASGTTVTVDYTPGTMPIQDLGGNDAIALSDQAVTASTGVMAPRLSGAAVDGTTLTLTYDKQLDANSVPAASAFTVTVDTMTASLADTNPVAVSGSTVTLTLATAVTSGQTVTLTYTVPETNPIQDAAGNAAAALTDEEVSTPAAPPADLRLSGLTAEYARSGTPDTYESLAFTFGATTLTYSLDVPSDAGKVRFAPSFGAQTISLTVTHTPPSGTEATLIGELTEDFSLVLSAALDAAGEHRFDFVLTPVSSDLGLTPGNNNGSDDRMTTYTVTVTKPAATAADPVLVSNTGQTLSTSAGTFSFDRAQAFTTGSNAAGYNLTQVDWRFNPQAGTEPSYAVEIWSESSNRPGTKLATLTSPATLEMGLNSFTASGAGIDLEASTTYFVVLDVSDSAGRRVGVPWTLSNGEDAGAAMGWSIADGSLSRTHTTPTWGTEDLEMLIAVRGTAKTAVADTTPPMLISAVVSGSTLTLTYDEPLDENSVPATNTITVTVGPSTRLPTSVDVMGSTVVLTLQAAVTPGTTVTVNYGGDSANPIQDQAGNAARVFSNQPVTEPDTTPPTLLSAVVSGTTLTLFYNETLDTASQPVVGDFTVTVGGTSASPSAVNVMGSTVVLTLASTVTSGATVTVTYVVPATNPIQDAAGNDAVALTNQAVTEPDTTAPTLLRATVSGTTLTLTYDEMLDAASMPAVGDFMVTVAGTSASPSAVNVTGSTVMLTLASAVASGATVTVTYVVPATNPIQDIFGNDAAALTNQAVTEPDTTAPMLVSATVSGSTLTLTYDEPLDEDSVPATTVFSVTVGTSSRGPTLVDITGSTVLLTLQAAVASGSTVRLTYAATAAVNAMNPIQDLSGNAAGLLTNQMVLVAEAVAPMLSNATVSGTTLTLTYDEPLDQNSVPAGSAFTVEVDSTGVNLAATNPVDVTGATVVLTLAQAVTSGSVTLTYAVPATMPIQDLFGNEAGALTDETVTVLSSDATLSALTLADASDGPLTLSPTFAAATTAYTASVGNAVDSVKVTATVTDANATLAGSLTKAGGTPAAVTMTSGAVATLSALAVGANVLTITVTAQDSTQMQYTLTVTRAAAPAVAPVLVSNTGQALTSSTSSLRFDLAQAFTTGDNAAGYRLTQVDWRFRPGTGDTDPTYAVEIWSESSDRPDTKQATLTNPDMLGTGLNELNSFTAAGSGVDLDANTTYFVVMDVTDRMGARDVRVPFASTNDEDAGAATGWSLGDGSLSLDNERSDADWGTGSPTVIAIRGTAKTAVADTTAPMLSSATVSGTTLTLTYNEALDETSVPAGSAFTVEVDSTGVSLAATDPVDVTGATVVLTLDQAVTSGSVTLDYAVPATMPIQDIAGNAAAALTDEAVTMLSSDATLSALSLTDGSNSPLTLTPTFAAAMTDYTASVGNVVTSMKVTATVNDANAMLAGSLTKAGGTAEMVTLTSGMATTVTGLAVGANVLTITVTAEDGTAQGYTLTVTRSANTSDTTPPSLTSAAVVGTALTLAYDEALDTGSVPAASAFTVTVDGTTATLATSNPVAVSGSAVTLTLAAAVTPGQAVVLDYTVPAANPIQDAAGNDAAALVAHGVNATSDSLAVPLQLAVMDIDYARSTSPDTYERPDYMFNRNRFAYSLDVPEDAARVQLGLTFVGGPTQTVQHTTPSGATSTLTGSPRTSDLDEAGTHKFEIIITSNIGSGRTVYTVLITKPASADTTAPSLSTATVSGTMLTLTYDEALDETSIPDAAAFTVMVAGSSATVSGVDVTGSTVVLTLGTAVISGQAVVVDYTVPATKPIRDAVGNAAATFTGRTATEPDTTAPMFTGATVEEATLTLNYDEPLDEDSVPAADAFTVEVDDVEVDLAATNPVDVTGAMVVLTLASAVTSSQVVTVAYTMQSMNPIRDEAGNNAAHLPAATATPVDTTPPVLTSATLDATTRTMIQLVYDEALDTNSRPAADAFTVTVAGSEASLSATNPVSIAGMTVTLQLALAVTAGQAAMVDYTVPDMNPIRDAAGNAAATFTGRMAIVPDTTAPVFSSATVEGTTLTLTYSEELDEDSTPVATAFDVTVGTATAANPSTVAVRGSTVVLTLATAVTTGQAVTVSYTAPATNPIRDEAGNAAADLATQTITATADTTAPTFTGATVEGTTLTLRYDEALDTGSMPAASTFTVTVGGNPATVSTVAVAGDTVTLTLAAAVTAGQSVTLSYSMPTMNPIQDAAGNAAADLANRMVTLVDTTAPVFTGATVEGTTLTLSYDEALDTGSMPAASAFTVTVGGNPATVSTAVVAGSTVTLTLAAAVTAGQSVVVAYTMPAMNPIQDAARNAAVDFANQMATAVDTTPPSLSGVAVSGTMLTLTYDEALDTNSRPAATAFMVSVAEAAAVNPSSVAVAGTTVVLTLAAAVTSGQMVSVTYTVPDTNPIQDADSNVAAPFANQTATAPDTTPPALSRATVEGTTLTLTYDEALNTGSMPAASAFTVTVGGNPATVSTAVVAGSTVTLTLAAAVTSGQMVALTYTVPATNPIQDAAGNAALALTTVTVNVVDTTAPSLTRATVEGTMLTLTYDEALGTGSMPPATVFTVSVDGGAGANPSSVSVAGSTVVLTLAAAVTSGQTVALTYTVPSANPIQDAAGNASPGFAGATVTVLDTTAPVLSTATAIGTMLTLTYDEALDTASMPAAANFLVSVAGSLASPSSVSVSGSAVVLTLASTVTFGQTVTVSYVVPSANPIQDAAGNAAAAFAEQSVTVENSPPDAMISPSEAQTVTAGDPLPLSSASTDPDGQALTYSWTARRDGLPANDTLSPRDAATTTFSTDTVGTYTVELTVTDSGGMTDSASLTVTVEAADSQVQERIARATKMTQPEFLRMAMNFAVDAITARLAPGGRAESGSALGLVGRLLNSTGLMNTGYLPQAGLPAQTDLPARSGLSGGDSGHAAPAPAGDLSAVLSAVSGGHAASEGALSRALGESGASIWASGGYRKQNGRDDANLKWSGDAYHLHVGVDKPFGDDLIGGLSVGYFSGDFDYIDRSEDAEGSGTIDTKISSIQPYLGWRASDRLNLWGMIGYGEGDIEVKDGEMDTQISDADQRMVALGGSYRLRGDPSTLQLDLKAEVSAGRLKIDGNGDDGMIEASSVSTSRWRLAVEGTREVALEDGRRLLPSLALGARVDRGDGVTGTGAELNAGLDYHDAARGLLVQTDVRWLPGYGSTGRVREWAASGAVRLLPQAGGRGLSFELSQSWGDVASGVERLWNNGAGQGWGDAAASGPRLETRLGYGMNGMGGLLTPYFGATHEGEGGSLLLGADWERGRTSFSLRGERRAGGGQEPDYSLRLELSSSW